MRQALLYGEAEAVHIRLLVVIRVERFERIDQVGRGLPRIDIGECRVARGSDLLHSGGDVQTAGELGVVVIRSAVTAAQHRMAVAEQVVSEAETRRDKERFRRGAG